MFFQVNFFAYSRPFLTSFSLSSGFLMRFRMWRESSFLLRGANMRAWSRKISFKLPPVEQITGMPWLIASSGGRPNPS